MTSYAPGSRSRRLSAAETEERAREVLGLTREAWRALRKTSRRTIQYACLEKTGQTEGEARRRARKYEAEGHQARAYPCPFSPPDHHFHVGHVPSIHAVARLQEAIRDLHGNLPVVHPNRG